MFPRIIASIVTMAFIVTQCGLGAAAPIIKDKAQNLRPRAAVSDGKEGRVAAAVGGELRLTQTAAPANAGGITRRDFITGAVGAGLAAAGYGLYKLGQRNAGQPQQPQTSQQPVVQPTMPQPTSELMRKVQDASKKIKEIAGENARFTVMWWDTANTQLSDFQSLADFGVNEIIVDGYRWIRGDIDDGTIIEFAIAAQKAGIVSFKFMMGDPNWPYEGKTAAIDFTAQLCEKLASIKDSLKNQGNAQAADILKGVAMDIEPYVSNSWKFDLGPYIDLHDKLKGIATKNGLSYNKVEAFWFTQIRVETGEELVGYVAPKEPVYLMSYRSTAEGTFAMSGFTGNKYKHISGFDFATLPPTGYKGNVNKLPDALLGYVNLSDTDATRRPNLHGAFLHFPKIEDVRAALDSWKAGETTKTEAKPVEEQKPVVEEPVTEEPEAPAKEAAPARPKPGRVKITSFSSSKAPDSTTIRFKVTGLGSFIDQAGALVVTHTDAYYPQPYGESIHDISQDGTVEVTIPTRAYKGTVTIFIVDKDEYAPQEYFHSDSQIKGVLVKYITGVRAALPVDQLEIALADEIEIAAERISLRNMAMANAPSVRWSAIAQAPVPVDRALATAAAAGIANTAGAPTPASTGIRARLAAAYTAARTRAAAARTATAPYVNRKTLGAAGLIATGYLGRPAVENYLKPSAAVVQTVSATPLPLSIRRKIPVTKSTHGDIFSYLNSSASEAGIIKISGEMQPGWAGDSFSLTFGPQEYMKLPAGESPTIIIKVTEASNVDRLVVFKKDGSRQALVLDGQPNKDGVVLYKGDFWEKSSAPGYTMREIRCDIVTMSQYTAVPANSFDVTLEASILSPSAATANAAAQPVVVEQAVSPEIIKQIEQPTVAPIIPEARVSAGIISQIDETEARAKAAVTRVLVVNEDPASDITVVINYLTGIGFNLENLVFENGAMTKEEIEASKQRNNCELVFIRRANGQINLLGEGLDVTVPSIEDKTLGQKLLAWCA